MAHLAFLHGLTSEMTDGQAARAVEGSSRLKKKLKCHILQM